MRRTPNDRQNKKPGRTHKDVKYTITPSFTQADPKVSRPKRRDVLTISFLDMTRFLRLLSPVIAALWLAACETVPEGPPPEYVPDMVVCTEYASFFRLGPQQPGGADLSLRTNETVMLRRKGFGYSRVQLEDGQVGYMANEDIQPAPPPPKPDRRYMPGKKKKGGGNSSGRDSDYDDFLPIPDPNLGLTPDDVPLEPLPDLLPEPVDTPQFIPRPTPQPTPIKETLPEKHETEPAPPVSTST